MAQHDWQRGHRNRQHDQSLAVGGPASASSMSRRHRTRRGGRLDTPRRSGCSRTPRARRPRRHASPSRRSNQVPARKPACLSPSRLAHRRIARRQACSVFLVNGPGRRLPYAPHGSTACAGAGQAVDMPDGFGVAVVREDGKWRCTPMRQAALNSLTAAETELRELRSAGAVFGLLDVDDEFFVIVRPAPAGTRLLLSDATAALDYDIAAEVLEKLDADIERRRSRRRRPVRGGRPRAAGRRRAARSGARRDPRRDRPVRRRAAAAGSPGRWVSPTSCRRCSSASIGEPIDRP